MSSLSLRPQAILFGDSITQYSSGPQGWGAVIANAFMRKVDVVNRGFSGYNARIAEHLLPYVFPPPADGSDAVGQKLLFVTIFFGANDAAQDDGQHVPLANYAQHMDTIVAHVKRLAEHVVVIAPPPVDHEQWPDRHNKHTKKYAELAKEVAERHEVPLINLFEDLIGSDWSEYLNDGLHLSDKGNEYLAERILKCLPDPEDLPFDFPLWREAIGPTPELYFKKEFIDTLPYQCKYHPLNGDSSDLKK